MTGGRGDDAAYAGAMASSGEQAATVAADAVAGEAAGAQVLLIEDEPGIVDFVRRGLEGHGLPGQRARSMGSRASALALERERRRVVLDLMLPGRSGLEMLAYAPPAKPELPVIVLTARGEVEDRVAGLDSGRRGLPGQAVLAGGARRADARAAAGRSRVGAPERLEAEDVEVDLLRARSAARARRSPSRRPSSSCSVHLMRHHDRCSCGREEILSAVWGYEHDPATNIVDVYIGYLRRKLRLPDSPGTDLHRALCRLPPRPCRLT